MKKFLLASTALSLVLGLSAVDAQARDAKKPTLTISGEATGSYHIFDNGNTKGEKGHGGHFAIEDSALYFLVSGRMDWFGQMFYDWQLSLNGDTGEDKAVEENRLRVRGEWGTVMFGNHQGVENFMSRGAFGVMGGTGGFDGNFKTVVNRPTGILLTTDMVGATKYATKATYVTPRALYGFQAGVSYTVNSEHKGEGSDNGPHNRTSLKTPGEAFDMNSWAGGINWLHSFENGLNLAVSATGIVASSRRPDTTRLPHVHNNNMFTATQRARVHNTASWAVGGVAEFRGFELGAEYIDNGKSRQYKTTGDFRDAGYQGVLGGFDAGEAWSVAAAYTYGPDRLAVGYYNSERKFNGKDSNVDVWSVTYDRQVAPGFSLFAEGNWFGMDTSTHAKEFQTAVKSAAESHSARDVPKLPSSATDDNNGHALILGAKFRF